ncbi:bactofilin family protein [Cupriavidus pampae]|uniref:Polymer-forming cytoskeletal protein n=1 Tax=Cupriavidus pampae TaxID=659251 RepID=A0ABM8XZA2_9BURK|nr:polymer-forming cytoskeletal protein [Cupriavidus pampae]CAG9185724.1 hypothetical protein LMG32289_06076 [Cupriavidus pampae]
MSTANFSLISAGLSIHGDVVADHGISCLGLVGGDLRSSQGLVHVGTEGLIRGTVEGDHLLLDGTVEGDVIARVSLHINGKVKGRIAYAGTIRLGPNAALEGTISRVAGIGYEAPVTPGRAVEAQPEPTNA